MLKKLKNGNISQAEDSLMSLNEGIDNNSVQYQSIFAGSKYQSPEDIVSERATLFENMSTNKFIITPTPDLREVALSLGMPTFKIIETTIKDRRPEQEKKNDES